MCFSRTVNRFIGSVGAVSNFICTPVNIPAPVKYLLPEEGGVSHFNYLRDNVLLTWMHARLLAEFIVRLPWLLWRRQRA